MTTGCPVDIACLQFSINKLRLLSEVPPLIQRLPIKLYSGIKLQADVLPIFLKFLFSEFKRLICFNVRFLFEWLIADTVNDANVLNNYI